MTPKEYIDLALRTENKTYRFAATGDVTPRIEHGVMGTVTEAAELMSTVKKSKIYGKELDRVNLVEEVGDVMWYLAILADELGVSFEDIWEKNIQKLRQRYPEGYTKDQALNRDLSKEHTVFEKDPVLKETGAKSNAEPPEKNATLF